MRRADPITWARIRALRTSLVDLLVTVPDDAWDAPTPCPGWRVRDVAAHVLLRPRTDLLALPGLLRARLDVARYVHDDAVRRGAAPVPDLLRAFRHAVRDTTVPPTRRPEHVLADLYVHTLDLRRALRLPPGAAPPAPAAPDLLRVVLDTVATDRVIGDPRRLAGLRLHAPDAEWSHGDATGAEVVGPADALLLAMSGRPSGLPDLTGPGVAVLAARLGRRPAGAGAPGAAGSPT